MQQESIFYLDTVKKMSLTRKPINLLFFQRDFTATLSDAILSILWLNINIIGEPGLSKQRNLSLGAHFLLSEKFVYFHFSFSGHPESSIHYVCSKLG